MIMTNWWAAIPVGCRVQSATGETIGEVVAVRATDVLVHDPVEKRDLLIPRDVCRSGPDGGICLIPHPVRAAGAGPERYRRRPSLDDDWVEQQTSVGSEIVVEGRDRLHGRRLGQLSTVAAEEAGINPVDSEESRPTEIERSK